MNAYLAAAAALAALIGVVHSILGERLLLGPLFERGHLPKLLGSSRFAKQTLRFAWHLTTVLLWAIAGVLWLLAIGAPRGLGPVIAWSFAVSALLSLIGTRGRHFSWLVFSAIAVLVWLGSG